MTWHSSRNFLFGLSKSGVLALDLRLDLSCLVCQGFTFELVARQSTFFSLVCPDLNWVLLPRFLVDGTLLFCLDQTVGVVFWIHVVIANWFVLQLPWVCGAVANWFVFLCLWFLCSLMSWMSIASLEVPATAAEVNILADSRLDPNSSDPNSLAALSDLLPEFWHKRRPFQIWTFRLNLRHSLVLVIQLFSFSNRRLKPRAGLSFTLLLLNVLVEGQAFQRSSRLYILDFSSSLTSL